MTVSGSGASERDSAASGTHARPYWLLLALPVTLYVLRASRFGAWLVDDALISFGYARTLELTGRLAQAPGAAPVEAISNPTWTVLLSGLRAVGVFDGGHSWLGYADYVWVIRGLAALCFAGTLACYYAAIAAVTTRLAAGLAALGAGSVLALSPPYVMWTVSGLENPLYGLIVVGLATVIVRSAARDSLLHPATAGAAALLVVLAAATRPDGLVFAAGYPLIAMILVRRRWLELLRVALVYSLVFLLPVSLLLWWRHSVFGLWVPNTAVAKGQSGISLSDLVARIGELPEMLTWYLLAVAVASCLAAVVLHRRDRSRSDALLSSTLMVALAILGFGVLRQDWMVEFRFGTPTVVLVTFCLGLSSAMIFDLARPKGDLPAALRYLVAGALSLTVVSVAALSGPRIDQRTSSLPISGCFVAERYGRMFNLYADLLQVGASGSLLLPDVGGTIMTSRLRVVDLAGLADPTVARLRAAGDLRALRKYVLTDIRPTFVHLHGSWQTGLPGDTRFERDYRALGLPGDYVRRSAVADDADLAAVTAQAQAADARMKQRDRTMDCGPLVVGQLPS